jgi:2-polyprenyl-3-methyl-5-hydroxy-6-metoxy-1,4-benzoquinol methylase
MLRSARGLWNENIQNWNLPLTKRQKLLTGIYIILHDFAEGRFPPTFDDRCKAYDAEIRYSSCLPGLTAEEIAVAELRKPFWRGELGRQFLVNHAHVCEALEDCGVVPPQSLLELGCGGGWSAEFLAAAGYDVLGTTISPVEVGHADKRVASLVAKELAPALEYRVSPMESVAGAVRDRTPFDCAYVIEALHHAFDWREALASVHACLKPGAWFLICNEPNALHTCISYRAARIANIHEIGFRRTELLRAIKRTGFSRVRVLRNRSDFYVRPHWIAAQK